VADGNMLDEIVLETGAFDTMDRGYEDFLAWKAEYVPFQNILAKFCSELPHS
jgi:hypothetical protein